MTISVSLEYEKAEMNTEYFYKSAEERVAQAEKEREIVNARVRQIIALKEQVCAPGETIAVFNK